MKMLIEFSLTGKMNQYNCLTQDLYKLNGCHTVQLPITAKPGIIKRFDGIDAIKKNKNVVSVFRRYNIDDEIPATGDVRQRICEIAFVVEKKETVSDSVKKIQDCIFVEKEQNENMLTSLVDATLLTY
jgi:hypothetical protein